MAEILIGRIYKHISGMRYKVEKLILNATGYEQGINPKRMVLYTQLKDGKFPSGTEWTREEDDFKKNFVLEK